MRSIYFDNAATTYPKAPNVSKAVCNYIDNIGANVGRGTYQSSYSAGQIVYETREMLCELFNFDNPMNVAFTMNITYAINIIIKGLLKPGDHVIVSELEHNAIMRPLTSQSKIGIEFDRIKCNESGTFNSNELKKLIKKNTRLVIMTHASNVSGAILPIEEIGKICRSNNLFFLLDSAQTAGVLNIDFKKFNLSGLAFTGHKGLLGPQGIGGFILDDAFANAINPIIEGGTGSFSESEAQPNYLPDKFECGTLNLPGIFGLNASLKYLKEIGIANIHKHEMKLTSYFIEKISDIPSIEIIGPKDITLRTSVVSINFKEMDNSMASFILDKDFGIMTRVGLHCAPSAHKSLKTFPIGTVRFSFGNFNTIEEIDYAIESILKIVKQC